MKIRCIALDLDRTTLDHNGCLSIGNRQALEYAIQKGIHIIIASGRPVSSLPEEITSIKGIEYAITSNGAAVYDLFHQKRLHSFAMVPSAVENVLRLTDGLGLAYEAFVDGIAYADAAYVADPVKHGASVHSISYIQHTRRPIQDMSVFIRDYIDRLDSLDLVVRSPEERSELWSMLQKEVPDIYITSSVPQLLELSHRDAGKRSGVRFLADFLNIPSNEIAAFGDGDNDAEMLSYVGCGIAVENATPACRAAADFVTRCHDDDGVAYGIYHILNL